MLSFVLSLVVADEFLLSLSQQLYQVFAFSISEDNSFDVVRDADGHVIGQIIGDGFKVDADDPAALFNLAIPSKG